MLRQPLGLALGKVGKSFYQHTRNPLMVAIPVTFEQRLISCILDKGVFEGICRVWMQALPIEQFNFH